jgi:flagellin
MTSILTNTSAMAALQTLRTIGNTMAETQRHVSSGQRVQIAADNAAYWSISTTMRSDAMAVSAVADALGLGAAKLDVAYAATENIVGILSEFKARLVAASEAGVDRAKIQQELGQLNAQAESTVKSANFSGVNWLETDAATHLQDIGVLSGRLVTSFVRGVAGDVSVKTADVDLKTTSMLNTGGGGILQKDGISELGDIGGLADATLQASAHNGHETHNFTGPATFGASDYLQFSVVIDAVPADLNVPVTAARADTGVTYTLRIEKGDIDAALGTTDGTINTASEMRTVLQKVFDDNAVPAWAEKPSGYTSFGGIFEIGSLETSGHNGSSIDIVSGSITSQIGSYPSGFALGLEDIPTNNHDNMYPKATLPFTSPFSVSGNHTIYYDVQIDGGPSQTVAINRATINAALGTTDGLVSNVDDFATVLAYASAGKGVTATSRDSEHPGVVTFFADPATYPRAGIAAARFNISNVRTDPPVTRAVPFDLDEVDVTGSDFTIDEYISGVDLMLEKAISSAGTLGALKTRIDMQTAFAHTLMDTIDKGIGRLVDADMNEASTRLKALQTQEQLAIQSLSIANTSAENVMQLFR